MPHNIFRTKLVILGDSTVGKTCLSQIFVTDGRDFPKNYNMTLGVDVLQKQINVADAGDTVEFLIYDSSGLDLYRDFLTKYWDMPSLLIIVYDVTLQSSFESVPHWLEIALGSQWNSPSNRPYIQVLVANKIDLAGRRFVSEDIGKRFAEKCNFHYFETSCKENQGVEEVFSWLAKEWHDYVKKNSSTLNQPFSRSAFKTSIVF